MTTYRKKSTAVMHESETVVARLRWLREFKELSLQEFASRIDCDPGYLSKLENGKAGSPSERFIAGVAVIFWVNAEWLRTGKGDKFVGAITDTRTRKALPQWSEKRLQRVFAILDELPDALAIDAVLGFLFREESLEGFQAVWREVMALPDLPAPARLFWNVAYMRFQILKMGEASRRNAGLTDDTLKSKCHDVQSEIQKLIEQVKRKASRRGAKSELARELDVAPARISEWLSGEKEPGGDYALRLQKWVKSQAHQPK